MSGTALETRRRVPFPWESLAEIFFPPACLACAQVLGATAFFCPSCAETLEPLPEPRCRQCSEPGDFKRGRCSRCTARPPPFERAVAPFSHQGAIARAIHELKYEDHPELAFRLAQLLAGLRRLQRDHPVIEDVRGLGLMIALEFAHSEQASTLVQRAFERGLLLLTAGSRAVRLCPPLVLTEDEADVALAILGEVVATLE